MMKRHECIRVVGFEASAEHQQPTSGAGFILINAMENTEWRGENIKSANWVAHHSKESYLEKDC